MKNKILEAIFILIFIALGLYFLFEIREIIVYIIISSVLALIGTPIVRFIGKLKIGKYQIPKYLAVISTLSLFFSLIILIFVSLVPLINEQANSLSLLEVDSIEKRIHSFIYSINLWLETRGIPRIDLLGQKSLREVIDFSFVPNLLNNLIGTMGGFSIGLLSVLFITFFFLKDEKIIVNAIFSAIPDGKEGKISKIINSIKLSLTRYLSGLILQVFILFIMYALLLYFVGIKHYFTIALLGAMLNLIPYVGPLIGFVLMSVLSITGNISYDFNDVVLPITFKVIIGYIFIQLFDNFINQPFIFSSTANAHPLEIFLVILIAGTIGGVIGMIIAVPSYTILRIVLKEFFSEFKFVKNLTKNIN